jgi:hypothetical protein
LTRRTLFLAILFTIIALPALTRADDKPPAAAPDVVIFTNGDQISGTFVREVGGNVTFHSDILGDVTIPLAKIKELRTTTKMAVIQANDIPRRGHRPTNVPQGTLTIASGLITVHPDNNAVIAPIPIEKAQFIIDDSTLHKQLFGHPGFFTGWNGSATLGLTLVQATQNSYNFAGALALTRTVPTVTWLSPSNRTTVLYSESYGKITQPAYTAADGTIVPEVITKTSIFHLGAERDEYVSPRFYYLGTVAFDHNYSQSLDLQQIYGGGIGYTFIKTPVQELDATAVVQYERQSFMNAVPPSPSNQDLIASTFGGTYIRHLTKGMLFTQQASYIPAWNDLHAYSFSETDVLTLPAWKSFGFSIGTLDTYLNDVPLTYPATKRNSFQFTFGATYTIKSKY